MGLELRMSQKNYISYTWNYFNILIQNSKACPSSFWIKAMMSETAWFKNSQKLHKRHNDSLICRRVTKITGTSRKGWFYFCGAIRGLAVRGNMCLRLEYKSERLIRTHHKGTYSLMAVLIRTYFVALVDTWNCPCHPLSTRSPQ